VRITARVPATSANLGPGFDCFGLALDLRSDTTLVLGEPFSIRVEGEGVNRIARDERNLIYRAVRTFYERVDRPLPPFAIEIHSRIPLTGGLGSSSAGIVGGLLAANVAAGRPMHADDLLALAAELDGHPDNVAPALLGGLVVVLGDTSRSGPTTVSLPIPEELSAVLFVPTFSMPTRRARALLPDVVPRRDAVFNSGRTALLVAALQTGRLDLLRLATQDRLHQPYRTKLFPALPTLIEAALAAGAHGAALSGAGSAVLALVTGRQSQIGQAMKDAALRRGIHGRWLAVDVARSGAEVVEEN
jgi:homoserine kinase